MKIAKAINFLALGGLLIGFGVFIKVAPREGFWFGLAVMLICFGVTLIGTATAAQIATRTPQRDVAPMEKQREVTLGYRVAASLLFGGISVFLFAVVVALVRHADHAAENRVWGWVLITTLIALVAAVAIVYALVAWGTLSNPKSRLGARVQKMHLADAVHYFLGEAAMAVLLLVVLSFLGIKQF
jgi:hypothetical protein